MNRFISASYFVQVVAVAVNFLYTLVIVHQLGASGYGDYSIFFNSLAFAILVLGFNLPSVIIFFTANRIVNERRLLTSCHVFISLTTLLLAVLLSFSDEFGFAGQIFPGGINKPVWIAFFVVQFFLIQSNQVMTAFLNAHKIFIPIAILGLAGNILVLLFWVLYNAGAITVNEAVFDLIWWVAIAVNLLVFTCSWWLMKSINISGKPGLITKTELHHLKGFLLIVYACNAFQFLNYKLDIYFLNYFDTRADVGIYALALSLSQLIWVLPNAVSGVLINYYQVSEKERSIALAVNYSRLCFYITLVCAAILLCIYYFALPLIYGNEFHETFLLCAILFTGTIPFSLSIMIANLNSGIGLVRINLYATVFVLILCVVLDILIIPVYGMTGAALVKAFVYIAGLGIQLAYGKKHYGLSLRSLVTLPDLKLIFPSKT